MKRARGRPPYPGLLTPAEERVFELVRSGRNNVEIAVELGVSVNTVRYHVGNLLQKAGLQSRGELREWEPGEVRDGGSGWLPSLGVPVKLLAVGTITLGTVAAVAVLAALLLPRGDQHEAEQAQLAVAVPTPVSQPQLASGRIQQVDTVALLHWETPEWLEIIDATTGEARFSMPTGYRPMVTFRRSANELLLADGVGADRVLNVLDLATLQLKRRVPTPDMPVSTVGTPGDWTTLSADGRYFAYSTVTLTQDSTTVHIIDLNSDMPPATYQLPRYCGVGHFRASGADGFAVACPTGEVFEFAPSGPSQTIAAPTARLQPDGHNAAEAVYTIQSNDGWSGVMFSQGSFVWRKPGQPEINFRAVPAGMVPRWPVWAEVSGGRLVVGYVQHNYDQYPEGLAVFDMSTGKIESTLPGYDSSRTMVAVGPTTLLAVTRDGGLISIDVTSGRERTLRALPGTPDDYGLIR